MTTVSVLDAGLAWEPEGPAPTLNGRLENVPDSPVVGAVESIAVHPSNSGLIWAGTPNGGVWRTESLFYGSDSIDNDNDGLIDGADPDEVWTATYANDGFDNDGDGSIDDADEVHWTAITDMLDSLSIGDISLDQSDATGNTLLVGVGRASSFYLFGGPTEGIYRITNAARSTADGGIDAPAKLDLPAGVNVSAVAASGGNIIATANLQGSGNSALAGVYRFTDPTANAEFLSGSTDPNSLPQGPAFDVIADPANSNRFFVGIGGANGGIYRTTDGGANWTNVGANAVSNDGVLATATPTLNSLISGQTSNIKFAIHNNGGTHVLYAGVVNTDTSVTETPSQLAGVFWSTDQGATWTAMAPPSTPDMDDSDGTNGPTEGIHPGGQGEIHFSISADPTNPNLLYVGGDRQPDPLPNSLGATRYTGRLFRGNRSGGAWTEITHGGTANASAPHADSRDQEHHPTLGLVEADDGGIFLNTNPSNATGSWVSLNGSMQVTEFTNVAYDPTSHTIIGGSQDNGTTLQSSAGAPIWNLMLGGDGGDVVVDPHSLAGSNQSILYYSAQNLGAFQWVAIDSNGLLDEPSTDIDTSGLTDFNPMFVTPVEMNQIPPTGLDSTGILIAGRPSFDAMNNMTAAGTLFESVDRGANWTPVNVPADFAGVNEIHGPLVFGGRMPDSADPSQFVDNPDLIYAGSGNQVFIRTTNGGMLTATSDLITDAGFFAGDIVDISVDPNNWQVAYAIDIDGDVFRTEDAGSNWNQLTGNLSSLVQSGASFDLATISVIPNVMVAGEDRAPRSVPIIGGTGGVFYLTDRTSGIGNPVWEQLGEGLPNLMVFDIDHGVDENGDTIVVAGTFGRGAWSYNLSEALSTPTLADRIGASGLNLAIDRATIITHGFEPFDDQGDSMLPLGYEIREAIDTSNGASGAWLLDYDSQTGQFDIEDSILPTDADMGATGEIVLMFDWSEGSRHASAGWPEAAGDALFSMLTELDLVNPQGGTGVDLHFIGHGSGAVVTSEAVERLAYYNVPVDQLTYLDPHDFDQGLVIDTAQDLGSHATMPGYGAAVWDNVEFADVYYQTRGENGSITPDVIVPEGRPIPGAYNHYIDATNYLPAASSSYDDLNVFGDHQYIWEGFYLSTVNGATPQTNESGSVTGDTPAPSTAIPVNNLGYSFSTTKATAARPSAQFFDTVSEPQDHTHTEDYVVTSSGTADLANLSEQRLTEDAVTNARQLPIWDPLTIVNGDFENVGDLIGFSERGIPGWTNHAASPIVDVADIDIDVENKSLTLDSDQPAVTHNAIFIPPEAEFMAIDVRVDSFSGNDLFQVLLGNTVLTEEAPGTDDVDLEFIDADFEKHRFVIPDSLRNESHNLTVRVVTGGDADINAAVSIDNIRFEGFLFEVQAGDVTAINLMELLDADSQAMAPTFNMISGVQDAGEILLPETLSPAETSFASSGVFYFIPDFETNGISLTFDDDDATPNNDDFATILFEVTVGADTVQKTARVRVHDGYTFDVDNPNSVFITGSVGASGVNNDIDEYRVQQRLRYLNFRGQNNEEVIVDGNAGSVTQQAIRLFQAATQENGLGSPDHNTFYVDGRVDVEHRTRRWLNSPLAPFWQDVRVGLQSPSEFEDESSGTSWAVHAMEHAVRERPDLLRTGAFEQFGLINLTEYPDNGPTAHSSPDHKSGVSIDWTLEEDSLLGAGTGVNPIDFTAPFDIDQANITAAERAVIQDVMALVTGINTVGAQVRNVNIGGTGGAPDYARIRSVLTHLGVPNVTTANGHDSFISINLLPPQGDTPLPANVQDNLTDGIEAIRDSWAVAILAQDDFQTTLPLVDTTIADSIDLARAFDIGLVQPLTQMLTMNSEPRVHDVQAQLEGLVVEEDGLRVALHDVRTDYVPLPFPQLTIDFVAKTQKINDVNAGGDLPQNSGSGPQNVLDARASAANFAVDVEVPMTLHIRDVVSNNVDGTATFLTSAFDVKVEGRSVTHFTENSLGNSVGVMPVNVTRPAVVMKADVDVAFDEADESGMLTLEQLNDPFLNDALSTTTTASQLDGVLPIEHTFCSFLAGGADPLVTISSIDVFNGLPAIVSPNGDFMPLEVFESLTNVDVLSYLDALSTAMNTLSDAMDFAEGIPFVGESLTSIINVGTMIDEIITDLSDGTEVLFENFETLIDQFSDTFGIAAEALNLRCDTATNSVLLDLNFERDYELPVPLDFGNELGSNHRSRWLRRHAGRAG